MILKYLTETKAIIDALDLKQVQAVINSLQDLKERGGRLFILGVGGSAANASHCVNDMRKIAGIESYAPTDNVAELTAYTNDIGWAWTFNYWLQASNVNDKDSVMVLSVGGGNDKTSNNIVHGLNWAKEVGATILGIVSRDGGETLRMADHCILIPPLYRDTITPHAEELQAVLWHLIVNELK